MIINVRTFGTDREYSVYPIAGKALGKKWYRFPVCVRMYTMGGREPWNPTLETVHWVLSDSAAKAANLIRDEYISRADFGGSIEVLTMGPKGGKVSRHVGWESYIGNLILSGRNDPVQLSLGEFPEI